MDTKLKRYRHPAVKGLAFVLLVLTIAVAAVGIFECVIRYEEQGYTPESLLTSQYRTSHQFANEVRAVFYNFSAGQQGYRTDEIPNGVGIEHNGTVYGNTPKSATWIKLEHDTITAYDELLPDRIGWLYDEALNGETSSTTVWFSDGWMAAKQAEWEEAMTFFDTMLWVLLPLVPLGLFLLVFVCITAGRRVGDEKLHLGHVEWLWTELLLGALALAVLGVLASVVAPISEIVNTGSLLGYSAETDRWVARTLIACGTVVCASVALWAFLACVRRLKDRTFFRHSACGMVIYACVRAVKKTVDWFRSVLDGRAYGKYAFTKMMFYRRRTFITIASVCAALLTLLFYSLFPFSLLVIGVAVVIIYWYCKADNGMLEDMGAIATHIERIADGDLEYKTPVPPSSPLRPSADKLENIGEGMNRSIQKQLRDERMKIELITNVSHDLKTPLTSIISYVDLLSREELTPEARDYVTILAKKSDRLKKIVSDLFELSKGTSGNLELHCEVLDFKRLTEQTLADMSEQIDAAKLSFRVRTPEAPVYIRGDGGKLYRVLQNVFDNALKYAMPGTRVFVDLRVLGARAVLNVKNTSSYEIDFTAQDIMERFARGDKARHSEGSGLGLSIAQSFTEACGGRFAVSVEDDQFRVHVSFAEVPAPQPEQEPALYEESPEEAAAAAPGESEPITEPVAEPASAEQTGEAPEAQS